ncbi:M13 family metallopeptidase [Rhodococcus sp. SGAir0479]|uniref:M13 family metallopeptidase n=1 Tax=Rhodococcus sp. SGAir0479 TaxID=2567884 RepID=UPI001585E8AE|nr:M13 family metallopeptidase [Rhodococcus sp. SGAir0479]
MKSAARTWVSGIAVGVVAAAGLAGCATEAAPQAPQATTAAFDTSELDSATDVCADLYGFVNGKWLAQAQIPPDESSFGMFDVLRDRSLEAQRDIAERAAGDVPGEDPSSDRYKLGVLYRDALDENAIDAAGARPLERLLASVDAVTSRDDVVRFLIDDAVRGGGVLFRSFSERDHADASRLIAYVSPTGLGLPAENYYTDPSYAPIVDAYREYTATALELVGVEPGAAAEQARRALALEEELAEVSLSPEEQRDQSADYRLVTVEEANRTTPSFDWRAYFEAQSVRAETFSLPQPAYFEKVESLLASAPVEQWRAYLRAGLVRQYDNRLSKSFRDNAFRYDQLISGATEQQPRWKDAVADVNSAMEDAMGRLYVEQEFDESAKAQAEQLVQSVLAAVRTRIENVDWMSDETKQKALHKWSSILPRIGYPDRWRDLSGLDVTAGDYFGSLLAADTFNHEFDMSRVGTQADRSEWITSPQTVNAFYNPLDNSVNFPAAILQAPFFDATVDDALNYGGIGVVIGHEVTHGFDDEGSRFDGAGNQVDWWTPTDRAEFDSRTARLVDQFDAYTPIATRPDLHVNGRLTLGENIADLGGVNAAYDALQTVLATEPGSGEVVLEGYTPSQRFFLNFARIWRTAVREEALVTQLETDPHSPARERTNGTVPNTPGFAQSFGCGPGDPMVHSGDDLVVVW